MPAETDEDFEKNVFINCPFDVQYYSLLRPLLFTILSFGFNPKIALERSDSGELRINKIFQLIKCSKYSIHDLSRIQSGKRNKFYRLNMPFELGIEYGSRHFSSNHLREKRCLILEKEKYSYIKALSDLSGVDIKSHKNDPATLVREVRNWFVETVGLQNLKSPTVIWYEFNDFMSAFYVIRQREGFSEDDLSMMPVPEFITFIKDWLQRNVDL